MRRPDFRLFCAASPPCGQECAKSAQILGLNKHLGKAGMGDIGGLIGQDQLAIGGDIDFDRLIA